MASSAVTLADSSWVMFAASSAVALDNVAANWSWRKDMASSAAALDPEHLVVVVGHLREQVEEHLEKLSASVTTSNDRVAVSRFTFEMGDPKHLGHLLNVVRNVEGVFDVYRVTSAA